MHNLLLDLRYAFRTLSKHPGLTLVVALSLAVGIGANATIFGMIEAILLRPLGYHDPSRLACLWERSPDMTTTRVSPATYAAWRTAASSFSETAALAPSSMVLSGDGEPRRLAVARVSEPFFRLLGTDAAAGRVFAPEEDQPGAAGAVVLTDTFWRNSFAADSRIVGRTLRLDDRLYTVVGVLPPQFRYHTRYDAYVPLAGAVPAALSTGDASLRQSRQRSLIVIARLKPGVTMERAQAEMDTIAAGVAQASPDTNRGWGAAVEGLQDSLVRGPRQDLPVTMTAAAFLLLIACANVANLMLAQAARRSREMALRSALGAGRARLVRQLFTESVLLAMFAGCLALVFTTVALRAIGRACPPEILPDGISFSPDARVFFFAGGVALVAAVLFGLLPAIRASKTDLAASIKQQTGASRGLSSNRTRALLVGVQLTLSLVLLSGTVLMVRAYTNAARSNGSLDTDRILTMRVELPSTRYLSAAESNEFFRQALEGADRLAGVEAAALSTSVPFGRDFAGRNFAIPGRTAPGERPFALFYAVSDGFFKTVGRQLQRGRNFTERDAAGAARVAIVNDALARRFPPNVDAVGQQLLLLNQAGGEAAGGGVSVEIVGVVSNDRPSSNLAPAPPQIYVPYPQHSSRSHFVLLKTAGPAGRWASPAVGVIRHIDKDQPVSDVRTLDELRARVFAVGRVTTSLIGSFGLFALVLTVLAVYSLVAYSATQRSHELGIRIALGSTRPGVVWVVLRDAARPAAIGLALGVAVAIGLARVLRGLLFGVPATSVTFLLGATVMLVLVTLAACSLPAIRAARSDPSEVLRSE